MIKENMNKEEMLKNVIHSTESAVVALSQLEENLIRGRFREGILPYETMCKTLVGQKIWTSDKENEKINKNFKQISRTAKNIIDILQPYIQNLNKLTTLDGEIILEDNKPYEVVDSTNNEKYNHDEEKVITAVGSSSKKQISYTKLRSLLEWDRKKLNQVIDNIAEKNGAITVTMAGSRKIITLKS